ncbi:CBS domain-containing protein [Pelagibius litoralis]|uniref:CBS domain-containing protein n=1 Tax=Pelagibius litoralis TaxID=374515 RepID=A0A967K7P3_9PROT|nr:DUF294 nucleotidyltransferase-like domain-containing protein [Pelagibius litoralis]NIA69958.1 CBS domain-containing protein [Pelagibius litoralis]
MSFARIQMSISALPLAALPAVVLDTETTGLDVAEDRVIEIGAVRSGGSGKDAKGKGGGEFEEIETYSALVNPAIPIPPASSEIHHIGDADVAAAPEFAEAMADFAQWSGPAVIVGYSIGFDLAILKAEHERNGLAWQTPRSLDVRHLVQLVSPSLTDPSLETVAAWLGLEVTERHRALSDALLTAQVFAALIPQLRQRGIATLSEAERACRSLTARMDEEAKAGWHAQGADGGAVKQSVAEYARVDSFPYRHRVADIMSAPPLVVAGTTPLKDALGLMAQKKVSSLFVAPESNTGPEGNIGKAKGEAFGIVTERDVLRALAAEGAGALDQKVDRFSQSPLVTIGGDEFVYRALARMSTKGFRHLGVVDPAGALTGALSARDLLRQRADDAVSLGDSIETATTPAALGLIWSELTTVVRTLAHEDVDARDIAAIVSRELRALTRRACELAESDMAAEGKGPPPVPYAMLVLGSGGRGESLLAMDQDNAIVFSEGAPGGTADLWFEELGKRVADTLNDAGVVYCKGGIMASNAAWRQDLDGWRETIGAWITRSKPEDILNCDIFFDATPVHGDTTLAQTLKDEALAAAQSARSFTKLLALNAGSFTLPLGWFGKVRLQDGRVDLKKGGIMPVFSTARVLALQYGLKAVSTRERLEAYRALQESAGIGSGMGPDRGADRGGDKNIGNLIEAHRILLNLILRQQLRDIAHGVPLSNKVAPGELTAYDRQQMKWALERIPSVADVLGTPALG